jgi:hypothetical protein
VNLPVLTFLPKEYRNPSSRFGILGRKGVSIPLDTGIALSPEEIRSRSMECRDLEPLGKTLCVRNCEDSTGEKEQQRRDKQKTPRRQRSLHDIPRYLKPLEIDTRQSGSFDLPRGRVSRANKTEIIINSGRFYAEAAEKVKKEGMFLWT